jgi:hypothetical protein
MDGARAASWAVPFQRLRDRALILFAHGARAASWAAPFERLRELTAPSGPTLPSRWPSSN